jgi:tight adherence protein B
VLPEPGLLIAVAIGSGIGAALVLLMAALRGVRLVGVLPLGWAPALRRLRLLLVSRRAGLALSGGVLVLVLTRWPVAAAAAAALIGAWSYLFGGARAEQQAIARLEALVIWTESLRDTVAANASLEQAIAVSTQRAPLVIQPALARLAGRMRAQTPLDVALRELAGDVDVPGADLVIAALILNVRRRGDRLGQVLSGLSTAAREELELRRRVSAGRAGLRRSVQIIVVVTVVIAGYLTLFGGAFMDPYDGALGQLALAVVLGFFIAGFVWMRRLASTQDTGALLGRRPEHRDPGEAQLVAALTGIGAHQRGDRSGEYRPSPAPRRGAR